MESKTYLKNLRVSPKKLRTFLAILKKQSPSQAVESLYYAPEKAAKILYKGVRSAIANAKNVLKVNEDMLEWKFLTIEEGQKLKRYRPGSRGNVKPFKIRFSHLKIILKVRTPAKEKEASVKTVEEKKIVKPVTVEKKTKSISVEKSKK